MDDVNKIEIFDELPSLSWAFEAVNASKAQQLSKGKGVKICLIDSGVESSHKEFNGKIKSSLNLIDRRIGLDEYGHGCISPKDEIFTSSNGIIKIEDFFNHTHSNITYLENEDIIKDVRLKNIYTMAIDKNGNCHRSKIEYIHKIKHNGIVYNIETFSENLTLTPWHPVYIKSGKNIKKIRADELKKTDKLILPNNLEDINEYQKLNYSQKDILLDEKLSYFIGLVFSDGHIDESHYSIRFTNYDETLINRFCELSNELFGYNPKIKFDKRNDKIRICEIYSKDIFNIVNKCGVDSGNKSKTIGFPEEIQKSPLSVVYSFLSGVIDGDGSICNGRLRITTGSERFAKETRIFLKTIGISSSYSVNPKSKGGFKNGGVSYNIRISNKEEIINGLVAERFKEKKDIVSKYKHKKYTGIKNITTKIHNGFMYDLTVEGYHNYIANGMIVSNTAMAGLLVGNNIGIAPDADLYVAKVLNKDGNGSFKNIIDGITYAINIKADILCMSLGTQSELPKPIIRKIKQAYNNGMIIVCASGNDGGRELDYPARLEEVIAVGGFNKEGQRSTFTNYNSEIDILAPSTDVISSYKDGKYCTMSGTSMATPIVAGTIALMKSYYKEKGIVVDSKNVKDFLSKNGNEKAWFNGYGNLNILKLLKDD